MINEYKINGISQQTIRNLDEIRYIVIMCHYRTKCMIYNKIYSTMLFDGTTVDQQGRYQNIIHPGIITAILYTI